MRCLLGAVGVLAGAAAHADVLVEGVEGGLRENVFAHMRLDEETCAAPEQRIRQIFESTPDDIRLALSAFGYYEPLIRAQIEFGEACWTANFTIDPGAPVRVRELDLRIDGEAINDVAFRALLGAFPLSRGSVLEHGTYDEWKSSVSNLSRQRGYIRAAFSTAQIDVYPDQQAADIALHFDSGPRYRFGAIQLRQSVLDEQLVSSYVDFEQGEPYDAQRLAALYVALNASGYFGAIDVRALPAVEAEREIPILISLEPGIRLVNFYGGGFSTDVGPRLRFGRTNRRVNSGGHQVAYNGQLSAVISELGWTYRLPYGDPRSEWVSLAAGLTRGDTESALSKSVEFGLRRTVRWRGDWTLTQSLSYLAEDYEVAFQSGRSRLLMPGLSWARLLADDAIRPAQGSRLDIELRGASDSLGSDASFLQAIWTAKWIWSRASNARYLTRIKLGATTQAEFLELPASVRFFAGGDASVRGFDFQSLGSMDSAGQVIGGSHLIVGSIEYEHPLRGRWSLATFMDSGNAFVGSDFEPETGVGFGVRWQSPLGPIRADVAWPVSRDDAGPRLHINFGPDL